MSRCVMCDREITEGYGQVCYNCEHNVLEKSNTDKKVDFLKLTKAIWQIIVKENLVVTNQNLDWLLERAFKEII